MISLSLTLVLNKALLMIMYVVPDRVLVMAVQFVKVGRTASGLTTEKRLE
jgi:hypothetical protein